MGPSTNLTVTDPTAERVTSMCHLTACAMGALGQVEKVLMSTGSENLSPIEFRTLLWARCALAALYGIRADESVSDPTLSDIRAMLDVAWRDPVPDRSAD